MYLIENVSTKKNYTCSKEEYEKFYKGKLNWKVINQDYQPGKEKSQVIENKTIVVSKKEVIKEEKPNTKKTNTNEKR